MADKENLELHGEIATAAGIARLWERIKQTFVRKDGDKVLSDNNFSDADKAKLDNLVSIEPATADRLGGVKVGAGLSVEEDGTLSVTSAGSVEWQDVQNTPTTLEGYGITDAATKDELEEVRTSIAKAYHFRGSVNTYDDLANVQNPQEGDVYNVKDTGKNYAWAVENDVGFWDDLGGTFEIDPLTPEDIDIITGYATSEEAFNEILEAGGDIELGGDITFSSPKTVTVDTTIDLSGYNIDSTIAKANKSPLFTADGAKLTIKGDGSVSNSYNIGNAVNGGEIIIEGGTFSAGNLGFTAVGGTVTFNGGSITAVEGGIGAFDNGSIEVNGGSIEGLDNFPLFTNGTAGRGGNTIVFNDGLLIGNITSEGYEACGIYIANNDTFIMNGGEIRSNNGCGLLMRAGDVTINDGKIVATGEAGTSGWVGDNKTAMSKSAVIYHESANYPGKEGMKLTINGGEFIGVDHSLEALSNEAEPQVFVNGGTFNPMYPEN